MTRASVSSLVVAATIALGGCAFVPKTNHRLEDARLGYLSAQADEALATAPGEMTRAREAFRLAEAAWNTLDDSAVVDHLAYVAKQRLAIAREVARRAAAEESARAARIEHEVIRASSTGAPLNRLAGDPR